MTYGIPVVTTMPGTGSFLEDHRLAMEMVGKHGAGYVNIALASCDVMLAIGTRFDDRLTSGINTFTPEAEIVHVDIDSAEIDKNIHTDYPLVGDAAEVLRQLDVSMNGVPDYDPWREQCQEWKDEIQWTTKP